MESFRKTSIRRKLIRITMITSVVVLVLACSAFITLELISHRAHLVREVNGLVEILSYNNAAGLQFNDVESVRENLNAVRTNRKIVLVDLFDSKGQLFASYRRNQDGGLEEVPRKPVEGEHWQGSLLSVYRPIALDGGTVGYLHVVADLKELKQRLENYGLVVLVILLMSSLVAYLLSTLLQKSISDPIRHLAEISKNVSERKDYTIRAEKKSEDELGYLVERFNEMLMQIEVQNLALNQSQEVLEKRVQDRTKDLEHEITVRKTTENELRMAKEFAEKANQAKSEFLSRMSHELRTPLNAILGFAQLMNFDKDKLLSKSHHAGLAQILKGGNHLLGLINDILDLSRVESGNMSVSIEDVNLGTLVQDSVVMVSSMANKINVKLINEVPEDCNVYARGDYMRLKQVLINLLSNAVKYNRMGGKVWIRLNSGRGEMCELAIEDTGIGISGEDIKVVFEPFHRLNSNHTSVEGTGIGLAITQRLLELMNGGVRVESQLDKGSVFTIRLPLSQRKNRMIDDLNLNEKLSAENAMEASTEGPKLVLYVEDNPDNLELVRKIFSVHINVPLETAADARTGIDIARSRKPDLILMDINLPGMDGVEAMKELKSDSGTREIPIVALSADAMENQIRNRLSEGFQDYITKPIKIPEFVEKVKKFLHETASRPV